MKAGKEISRSFNVDAQIIGHCEEMEGHQVTVKSENGTYTYNG